MLHLLEVRGCSPPNRRASHPPLGVVHRGCGPPTACRLAVLSVGPVGGAHAAQVGLSLRCVCARNAVLAARGAPGVGVAARLARQARSRLGLRQRRGQETRCQQACMAGTQTNGPATETGTVKDVSTGVRLRSQLAPTLARRTATFPAVMAPYHGDMFGLTPHVTKHALQHCGTPVCGGSVLTPSLQEAS